MRTWRVCLSMLALSWASAAYGAETPALVRARAAYNATDYDGAIAAAAAASLQPASSDAAALVTARAHLERYRRERGPETSASTSPEFDADIESSDLAAARQALESVHAGALMPRDQVDLQVGLGQSLYLSGRFGAAAELFDTALGHAALLTPRDRTLLLDWWASALDREAQGRPPERRSLVFERILERMQEELRQDSGSAAANYWLAVASRGVGDVERAWDSAVAGWVRAALEPSTSQALRADLDRLVTQALIPERIKAKPAREQADETLALSAQWESFKQEWK